MRTSLLFTVVVNDEEQYSTWPANRPAPAGWHETGHRGTEQECLGHISELWQDVRPRSSRLPTAE